MESPEGRAVAQAFEAETMGECGITFSDMPADTYYLLKRIKAERQRQESEALKQIPQRGPGRPGYAGR